MEQLSHSFTCFSELWIALKQLYPDDFSLLPSGEMRCLSSPMKLYDLDEVSLSLPVSLTIPATLYLISTKDGLYKGTLLDWHH